MRPLLKVYFLSSSLGLSALTNISFSCVALSNDDCTIDAILVESQLHLQNHVYLVNLQYSEQFQSR